MQNTYGLYEQKPPPNPQKIRPHPNHTQCNLGNPNGCVLLLFAEMILTDGLRLTARSQKQLHSFAKQAGIKHTDYQKPYYKISPERVPVIKALGGLLVSKLIIDNLIELRCKS